MVDAARLLCVFQAESLIHMLGNSVVSSIKKDYGKNVDLTLLWNTTMTGVWHHCGDAIFPTSLFAILELTVDVIVKGILQQG